MKKIIMVLIACLLFGACMDNHGAKTEAQKVVLQYLLAGTAEERAPYVLNPQEELPRMQKMYGNTNVSWKERKFQFAEEKSNSDKTAVMVKHENGDTGYILEKEGNNFKIDWSLSQFLNKFSPTGDTLKKMYLEVDRQKHSLFVTVESSTYYNYAFSKDRGTMYAFKMSDHSFKWVYGYCYKNNTACKELFNTLKEKSSCIVSLDAWYPNKVFREFRIVGDHAEIGNIKIKSCF